MLSAKESIFMPSKLRQVPFISGVSTGGTLNRKNVTEVEFENMANMSVQASFEDTNTTEVLIHVL